MRRDAVPPPGRGRSRAIVGVLAALVLWPAVVTAAPPLPLPTPLPPPPVPVTNPFIPPLGTQPAVGAGVCQFAQLGPTEVRQLYYANSEPAAAPGSSFGIDPACPGHVFRSLQGRIVRSDAGGKQNSFVNIFSDNSGQSTFSRGPFAISPVETTGGGPTYFYDASGNNGVVYSAAEGANWQQRNQGLYAAGVGPTGGISAFAVAPGNPNYVYLAGNIGGGQSVVYATTNGGQQWQVAQQPGPPITSLSVDPGNPAHVLAAAGGPRTAAARAGLGTYYESRNAGAGWTAMPGPPGELSPDEVLITGPGRVYAKTGTQDATTVTGLTSQKFWRLDATGAWRLIVIPRGLGLDTSFAYNPANPNEMLLAAPSGNSVAFAGSLDGFNTTRYANVIPTFNAVQAIEMRADRFGDFFVQSKGSNMDQLFALRVTALATTPPPTQTNQGPNFEVPLKECALAPTGPASGGGPLGGAKPPAPVSGSIAFDGLNLDYTHDQLQPGVIHRVNPRTCADAGSITLSADDMGGTQHALLSVTYDPKYVFDNGHVGAILARGGVGTQHDPRVRAANWAAVYAVDPAPNPARPELAATVVCGDSNSGTSCGLQDPNLFNYDHYLDALWAPVDAGPYSAPRPGLVRLPAHKGDPVVSLPTCMTRFSPLSSAETQDMSAWEPGAEGVLYVGLDTPDDTVLRVDSRSCQTLDSFTHEAYHEGSNENDQMACDAITFGEGAPNVPPGTGTSVLWIRDDAQNVARAYTIVKGFCPFPDELRLDQPPATARPGDTVTLCAVLSAVTAGVKAALAGQTIEFSLGGHSLGSAVTDAAGRACLQTAIPAVDGNTQLTAGFAGTPAYLPATALSSIRVSATPPIPPPPPASQVPPPAHVAPPNVAIVPAPPPLVQATQAQGQAQAQSQAQAQAQAQGQPGLMTERQRQARVNLARLDGARHMADLEASRYHTALAGQGAGLGLFALGLFLKYRRNRRIRPAAARAGTERGRR